MYRWNSHRNIFVDFPQSTTNSKPLQLPTFTRGIGECVCTIYEKCISTESARILPPRKIPAVRYVHFCSCVCQQWCVTRYALTCRSMSPTLEACEDRGRPGVLCRQKLSLCGFLHSVLYWHVVRWYVKCGDSLYCLNCGVCK